MEGSRKIWEFTPEQEKNLHAIVWLYRGETERYLQLVSQYLGDAIDEARQCFEWEDEEGQTLRPLHEYVDVLKSLREILSPVLKSLPKNGQHRQLVTELDKEFALFMQDIEQFRKRADKAASQWEQTPDTNAGLVKLTQQFEPMAETSRDLIKQTDLIYKLATRLIDTCETECNAWVSRDITRARKAADEARDLVVEQLKQVRYFWKQARWLTERFPEAEPSWC